MNPKYTYEDFLGIIAKLRSENGCPWDKEQTHESLKPCVMEEAAELVAAIRIYEKTKNPENMIEELGDLLLQVVMHAEIAKEEGLFTMVDVVDTVAEKMVRRHPHVFQNQSLKDAEEVLEQWDEIKKKEKEGKEWIESPLKEIPLELPALTRASKVLKKADKAYGIKNTYEKDMETLKNVTEKLSFLSIDSEKEEISTLVGDALVALSDVSKLCKFSNEQILIDRIEDFIDRVEGNCIETIDEVHL